MSTVEMFDGRLYMSDGSVFPQQESAEEVIADRREVVRHDLPRAVRQLLNRLVQVLHQPSGLRCELGGEIRGAAIRVQANVERNQLVLGHVVFIPASDCAPEPSTGGAA